MPPDGLKTGQAFAWVDRFLDKGVYGPSWLGRPEIAEIAVNALHYAQENLQHYRLHAYVIMPNHVHILITPLLPIPKIMQSIKGFTAREANLLLDRMGMPFWQREYYDHWVRDGEFERIKRYIELNPVKAGLASEPSLYRWSSATPLEAGLKAGSPAGLPASQW